jgi:hypothetical protein
LETNLFAFEVRSPVSRDGRYLANTLSLGDQRPPAGPALQILDLKQMTIITAPTRTDTILVGWSAGGALIYMEPFGSQDGSFADAGRLMRFDPLTGEHRPLADQPAMPFLMSENVWQPDGEAVLVGLLFDLDAPDDGLGTPFWYMSPALVQVDENAPPERLADYGYGSALSPDGRWLAYGRPEQAIDGGEWHLPAIEALDRATGQRHELYAVQPPGGEVQLAYALPLAWSPDSAWLLAMVAGNDGATLLVAAALDAPPRVLLQRPPQTGGFYSLVGFSHDGATLAFLSQEQDSAKLYLVDMRSLSESAPVEPQLAAERVTAADWSLDGRLLAMAGSDGVWVLDPATGAQRWVVVGNCHGVRWLE